MKKFTVKQMISLLQECENPKAEVVILLYGAGTQIPTRLRFDGTGEEESNRFVLGLKEEDHDAVTDRLDVLANTKEEMLCLRGEVESTTELFRDHLDSVNMDLDTARSSFDDAVRDLDSLENIGTAIGKLHAKMEEA